jgi:hypothetical protein
MSDGEECFVEAIENLDWKEEPMIVISGRAVLATAEG